MVLNQEAKLGLKFTKNELEEVLHEGPVMPMKHEGAFEVKDQYMDDLSSARSQKSKNSQEMAQKVAKEALKVETISPYADPNSQINTEIVLKDM